MDIREVEVGVRECVEHIVGSALVAGFDDTLLDHGLNSMSVVELTLGLEDRFGVVFGDDELRFENFSTVGVATALIHEKLAASRGESA